MTWSELSLLVQKRANQAYAMECKSKKLGGLKGFRLKDNARKLRAAVEESVQILGDKHTNDSEKENSIKSMFLHVITDKSFSFEGCEG